MVSLVDNDGPPRREVEVVDAEIRRATDLVLTYVVVDHDIPAADRVKEDALS